MKKEFWKEWKKKTKQEEKAIKSLKLGKKIVLENIPRNEIAAIYAKGSFIRRDMNKNSDVDLFVVLKTKKCLNKLNLLGKKVKNDYSPKINIGTGYTLWELKKGKKLKQDEKKPHPARINKHIPHYNLLYGREIKDKELYYKDDRVLLKGLVKTFNEYFLPSYKKEEIYFSELVKQVFWLVDFEQRAKGKKVPHSWKKLNTSIKDKKHIIHLTYKYRKNKPTDKRLRKEYIRKLKEYLKKLEKEFK